MTQRKYAVLIAFALFVAAGSLSGCGSSSTSASTPGQNQAAKANVTIAAKFPTSDGAVKSLIPAAAQVIEVYARSVPTPDPINPNGVLLATLTPTEQSKSVQIAPGLYMVNAIAYDSANVATRNMVGQTSTGGEVVSGQSNTIVLTFLDGQWTIVDANDVASPLVLSNGTVLNDFIVGGNSQSMYKAGKSAINYAKPIGGGSATVRMRFNNNTSARAFGWMASQFVGTTNSAMLESDSYNLTKKCGFDNYYGIPCDENAGDQIVMLSGKGSSSQSGGSYQGDILYGSADTLITGSGQTSFTQNGVAIDLMAAFPDTVVSGGNLITGGIVEWKPSTDRVSALGTPATAKVAKSAKVVKAQSSNTAYANLTVKDIETIVCSGSNPQNRGTWSFANNTSAGKVVLGGKVCYTNYPQVMNQFDPILMQNTQNAGDYSYGLVPVDTANLGDYCHWWDNDMYLPYDPTTNPTGTALNPNYNKRCKQILPSAGDVYRPWNFRAVATSTKTAINYGSFKFNFWRENSQNGTAYIYPYRAKGSTTVLPAK